MLSSTLVHVLVKFFFLLIVYVFCPGIECVVDEEKAYNNYTLL
jgi:hypothetical protein